MKKFEHINLNQYADKREVYQALQDHYNRDTNIHYYWHIVFFISCIGGIVVAHHEDWFWLFAGMYSLERALSRWVDNSNRNWFMHTIDWLENGWTSNADDDN